MTIARNTMAQRPPDSDVWEAGNQHPVARRSPEEQQCADPERYCAYNQTRGQILGSEVEVADFSVASFNDRTGTLAANSGGGLWVIPFRGISPMCERTPLDLIYLDANSVVIDIVECFPTFRISTASSPAASVLALPRNTISSTQTRRSDQLLLCLAAEFSWRLMQLPGSSSNVATAQSTGCRKAQPSCSGSGGRLQSDDFAEQKRLNLDAPPVDDSLTRQSSRDDWNDGKGRNLKPTKNWLQRWWSPDPPDPRMARRESIPDLGAQFFTGGAPVKHSVRDISLTGLYVLTEERWFPGTRVRMTLIDSGDPAIKNSITADTSVVRWGNDGVGLQFVTENETSLKRGQNSLVGGVEKKEFDRFLQQAKNGKRDSEARGAASRNYVVQGSATPYTGEQSFPLSVGPRPIGDERGGNSYVIGDSTGPAAMDYSWQGVGGIEAPALCEASYPLSGIPESRIGSPKQRGEAIIGLAASHFSDLFIGPINSSLLIDSLKDLPIPASVAGASPLMNSPKASLLQMPGVASSRRRPRILLIDDEDLEIAFLAGTLEEDYEIISANDGVTALESAGCNMPDLILLDVMMPGIDGFEVCRRLKADDRTKEIPVIFITGLSEAAFETRGLKMGAVDYISKPFHPAPLRARVNMHIKLKAAWEG